MMATKPVVRAVVRHWFQAGPERVFDAWLKRDLIDQWMFGPAVHEDEEIVHLSLSPRVGGAFSFLVERAGEPLEHVGKYLVIERPRRLAFTWIVTDEPVGSRVLVEFEARDGGCGLTLTQELHPSRLDDVERIVVDWTRMLDALEEALGAG